MKKTFVKVLSLMLALAMLAGCFVTVASAEEAVIECPGEGNMHTDADIAHATKIGAKVEPMCDKSGYQLYYCNGCHDYFMAEITPATGEAHELVECAAKEPTCTDEGQKAYEKCSKCGALYVDGVRTSAADLDAAIAIAALGHDLVEESTGDCLEQGYITSNCKRCDYTNTELVDGTGEGHQWEFVIVETAPTILADGSFQKGVALYVCRAKGCGAECRFEVECNHNRDDVIPAVEATCTETGLTEGAKCSYCGYVTLKQTVVPVKPHSKVDDEAVAPTCTTTGLTAGSHCSVCGETVVAQDEIPATLCQDAKKEMIWAVMGNCETDAYSSGEKCSKCGYIWKAPENLGKIHVTTKSTEPATCTKYGHEVEYCKLCGEEVSFKTISPIGAHTSFEDAKKDGLVDVKNPDKKASCEEDGYYKWNCKICKEECKEVIRATDHMIEKKEISATCSSYAYSFTYCTNDNCTVTALVVEKEVDGVVYDLTVNGEGVKLLGDVEVYEAEGYNGDNHSDPHFDRPLNDPTCTEAGSWFEYCGDCGHDDILMTTPALGHSYDRAEATYEVIEVVPPTCITKGYTIIKCTDCGEKTNTKHTDEIAHNEQVIPGRAPTCTAEGKTEGLVCGNSYCRKVLEAQATIPETGHKWGDWVTVLPTCAGDKGYKYRVCAAGCTEDDENSYTTYEYVADGENVIVFSSLEVAQSVHDIDISSEDLVREVTCTLYGITTYNCVKCDKNIIIKTAASHDWKELVAVAPTCTTVGYEQGSECQRCGEVSGYTEIPALGHSFTVEKYDANYHWTECAVCEVIKSGTKAEHDLGEGVVTTKPTCTVDGVRTFTCDCGYTETKAEPATGHDWKTEYTWTEYDFKKKVNGKHWFDCNNGCGVKLGEEFHTYTSSVVLEPTCTEMGKTEYACGCGYSYVKTDVPKLAHKDSGNDCWVKTELESPLGCTTAQYVEYQCSLCKAYKLGNYRKPLGHAEEIIPAVEATCDKPGYTEGSRCANGCDDSTVNVAPVEIPATGEHRNAADKLLFDSCKNEEEDRLCVTCGVTFAQGHNPDSIQSVDFDATCMNAGYTLHICKDCLTSWTQETETKNPENHQHWGEWVEVAPTCTEEGSKTRTCACGNSVETEPIPATKHVKGAYEFNDEFHWNLCSVCDVKMNTEDEHTWTVTKEVPAAPGVAGKIDYACVCGNTKSEDTVFTDLVVSFDYYSGTANRKDAAIVNGGLVVLNVYLEGTAAEVENIQIKFNYDATRLSFVNISYDAADVKFDNQVATINNGSAVIIFAGAAEGASAGDMATVTGKQLVASITFRVNDYADVFTAALAANKTATAINGYSASAYKADKTPFVVEVPEKALEIEIVKLGAVSTDYVIDGLDLIEIKDLIVAEKYVAEADINRDGEVDAIDYLELLNYLGGKYTYEVFAGIGK